MIPVRSLGRVLGAILVAASFLACGQDASPSGIATPPVATAPAPSAAPTSAAGATTQPSLDRNAGWRADLASLVPGMAAIHPDLTHGVSRADLDGAVGALSVTVDAATDDQLMVGVLRIVALVSAAGCDAHTGAYIWGSGTYPVDSLPLRLWLFANEDGIDEVVVVDALAPYEALIGSRIDRIEGHPIADVLAAIDPIVPRDNSQTVRLLTPRFLLIPQVLRGLALADAGAISLALTAANGAASTIDVEPVPMAAYNAWAGPYGLHLPSDPDVPYLAYIDTALWWKLQSDGETLFVQYNRADHLPDKLIDDLRSALHAPNVERVILDVRHNYGGELTALDAVQPLFEDPAVDRPDRLFVFTGRNTFSAGSLLVARLDRNTGAVLMGEPMGGCPTIWSDPSELLLPHSGIVVNVADDVAIGVDAADSRLTIQPDVAAVLSREEWAAARDPALELLEVVAP
jgi:hypothetical protein